MDNYTVILFTFNEEKRVEYALRNFCSRAPIVVIDNFSTDRTLEIASKYTSSIYQYQNEGWLDKGAISYGLSKAKTDWVCIAYAGEIVPVQLLNILNEVSREDIFKAVRCYRKSISYGRWTHRGRRKATGARFFKKGAIDFNHSMIHAEYRLAVPDSDVLTLPATDNLSTWQFRDYDTSRTEQVHRIYSDIEARQRHQRGERTSLLRLLFLPVKEFLKAYLCTGSFRSGMPGFLNAAWRATMYFNIQARLWEYQEDMTLESVRRMHSDMKELMLQELKEMD